MSIEDIHNSKIKTAIVTGGARRIGAAIVTYLHQHHYNIILHCHTSTQHATNLQQQLNHIRANSVTVIIADLIKPNAVKSIIKAVAKVSSLDLLINNASIFKPTLFPFINKTNSYNIDFTKTCADIYTDWDTTFHINAKIPYLLSLACYPYLAKATGSIINLSDIHSLSPLKKYSLYCQTKAALNTQTKALAKEFAPLVRVNAIAPGAIMWPEAENELSVEQKEHIINKTPLKKHGHPLAIAKMVLALAENNFITGQILNIDGGRSI